MNMDSSKPHIAIVGRRNVGKSLLVNSLLNKDVTKVSEIAGTTTDIIATKFELLPYGPVVILDTAGIDDEGELGTKKITETIKILSSSDFVVVVLDARETLQSKELELFSYLDKLQISFIVAVNKIEFGINPELLDELRELRLTHFEVSCKEKAGIDELKKRMIRLLPQDNEPPLISDIVKQGDVILLVIPQDISLPKRKLILSQVHIIREALDENVVVIACREKELQNFLNNNLKTYPDMIIVDNSAFAKISEFVPSKIKLTTFSIIMSRHKGELPLFVDGLNTLNKIKAGDKILVAEVCNNHHYVDGFDLKKIKSWLKNNYNSNPKIDVVTGYDLPDNLSEYKVIIHCSGCLLTHRAMQTRLNEAKLMNVPVVNYGVLISYMHGAVPRALLPFEEAISEWEKVKGK